MQMETLKKLEEWYLDKIDFKSKAITRDKEGHYLMIKGAVQQEDVNIYAPDI